MVDRFVPIYGGVLIEGETMRGHMVRMENGLYVLFDDYDDLHAACDNLRALLTRARIYVAQDVQMMADMTRFAPFDAKTQAEHDATEYDSEKLLPEIDIAIGKSPGGAPAPGNETGVSGDVADTGVLKRDAPSAGDGRG